MLRTQIYLPKSQKQALRRLAQKQNTTVSGVIRDVLQEKLNGRMHAKTRVPETLLEAAKRINQLGKKGPKDLASNLDRYLYGGK
jgi:hypothetical protein